LPDGDYAFPALRKLYVIDSTMPVPAFTHLTSQATDVTISHRSIALLQSIISGRYVPVVWPRLEMLSCYFIEEEAIDTFVTFAGMRPKNSFVFRFHPKLFAEDDSELEALKKISLVQLDEHGWKI
jgi:hypothetical protein